jgi:hypothetical protein
MQQKAKKEVKKELTKEDVNKRIIDDKFSGNCLRMEVRKPQGTNLIKYT